MEFLDDITLYEDDDKLWVIFAFNGKYEDAVCFYKNMPARQVIFRLDELMENMMHKYLWKSDNRRGKYERPEED